MIYYEVMFEAIQDRYNNGEITYEQAEELNELAAKKARLAVLESNNKNVKSQGVVKKLRRQIRNLEK